MGAWIKLTAADGNELSAYEAKPASEPIGAVVVVQEIFGVNPSIRERGGSTLPRTGLSMRLRRRCSTALRTGYRADDTRAEDMAEAFSALSGCWSTESDAEGCGGGICRGEEDGEGCGCGGVLLWRADELALGDARGKR